MKEYKMVKWVVIIWYVAFVCVTGLFLAVLIIPSKIINGEQESLIGFFSFIYFTLFVFLVHVIRNVNKPKFVICDDKVYIRTLFCKKELLLDDILGYKIINVRINGIFPLKSIEIQTLKGNTTAINIVGLSKSDELIQWLASRFKNLDLQKAEEVSQSVGKDKQEILSNEKFGSTIGQREDKLKKAHLVAKILNVTGGLVAAWAFLWPDPYEYVILALIAVPIVSIVVLKLSKGLIKFDEKKESASPTLIYSIAVTSLVLCLRTWYDFKIFDYNNIWIPATLITVVLIVLLLVGNKELKFKESKDYFSILGIAVFLFIYSYSSVVSVNCYYDQSDPDFFSAKVLSKRISSSRYTTTYYLELTPWGGQKEIDEVAVPEELYNQLDNENQVNIYLYRGKFEIPWFYVTE